MHVAFPSLTFLQRIPSHIRSRLTIASNARSHRPFRSPVPSLFSFFSISIRFRWEGCKRSTTRSSSSSSNTNGRKEGGGGSHVHVETQGSNVKRGRDDLESSDDEPGDGRREGDVPKRSVDADVLPRIRSKQKEKKIDPRETTAVAAAAGGIGSLSAPLDCNMPKDKKKGKERRRSWSHAKVRSKLVSHRVQAMKETYQVDGEDKPSTSKEVPVLLESTSPSRPPAKEPPSSHEEGRATEPNDLPLHAKAAQYLAMVGRKLNKRDPLRPKKDFLGQRLIALIMHGDRRTSSYMHFKKSLYDRMVQGKASLTSKSLKVDEAGSYLIHQPASNKRRQPARMVPCANDWMDLIERADVELQHPNNPNGLHSYLLAKGFAKPPLLACQLWVQHCIPCEEENEEGCKAVDDLELLTKKEVVDLLRQRNDESPVSN